MLCKNCNENIVSSPKFCPHCGQEIIEKLDAKYLKHALIEGFSFDKGFSYNIIKLLSEGGNSVNRFISGQTKPFQNPVMFFLTTLGILFLVQSLTEGLISGEFILFDDEGKSGTINIDVRGPDSDQVRWLYFVIITLVVPLFGLIFHALRDHKDESFVRALFASIFLLSAVNLIQSFVVLTNRLVFHFINEITGYYETSAIGTVASATLILPYILFFFYSYFEQKRSRKIILVFIIIIVMIIGLYFLDQSMSTSIVTEG